MQLEIRALLFDILVIPGQCGYTATSKCPEVKMPLSKERLVQVHVELFYVIGLTMTHIPDLRGLIHRCLVEKQLSRLLDRTK